jgi:hypothetical protein
MSERNQRAALLAAGGLLCLTLVLAVGCTAAPQPGVSSGPGTTSDRPTVTPAPSHPPLPLTGGPSAPVVTGGPGIKPHLSAIPAFTADDLAAYVKTNPLPGNLASGGTPTITRNQFLTAADLRNLLGISLGRSENALLGYVEMKAGFAIGGPGSSSLPPVYPYSYAIFDAQTGNLLMYGGLSGPTSTNAPAATATASSKPTATATRTPTPVPHLSVSPTGTNYVTCGSLPLSYPSVTVRNSGGGTLAWQASATNVHVTLSPASGSLGAGQSQTMTVSQTSGGAGTDIHVTSNGGSATVSYMCIPG